MLSLRSSVDEKEEAEIKDGLPRFDWISAHIWLIKFISSHRIQPIQLILYILYIYTHGYIHPTMA